MSHPRAPRNMQVTADDLEHRQPDAADAAGELAALKARIAAAGQLQPLPHERHCLDCFKRGRDAAIRAIVGETSA